MVVVALGCTFDLLVELIKDSISLSRVTHNFQRWLDIALSLKSLLRVQGHSVATFENLSMCNFRPFFRLNRPDTVISGPGWITGIKLMDIALQRLLAYQASESGVAVFKSEIITLYWNNPHWILKADNGRLSGERSAFQYLDLKSMKYNLRSTHLYGQFMVVWH